jgi:exosortase/archaeosortase family protein
MKTDPKLISKAFSSLQKRVNLFYLLAFIPLLLISYYNAWDLVIAFYGFVFFLLKSDILSSAKEASPLQKILGVVILVTSFFVYYALILFIPTVGFYGGANYFGFLLGLFLVFFDFSSLKEAFTPLFFIAAALSSSLVAAWLEPYLTPYLGNVASLITSVLKPLGINASVDYSGVPTIGFKSLSGSYIAAGFVYGCLGVFSVLLFAIILVIVLFEDPSGWKIRLAASIIGVAGTLGINIIRVTIIFVTDYIYGAEAGATVHYVIGYALFSSWLVLFLYVYYKREAIKNKILK